MSSVDVIVPCYRYGRFLRGCVESVLAQPGVDVRVLIIDDASPDNTGEIAGELAREDSRVTVIRHTTNQGHINTYNEGIEWVAADYMLLLSADDYLLPGALMLAANLMDAHSEVGFTFGKVVELDDRQSSGQAVVPCEATNKSKYRVLSGMEFIEISGSTNIVKTPTAVVRTALQKRLGGYRPELPHSGDMEMWFRFAAHASVGILDEYQAVYRRHAANMTLAYLTQGWLPDLQQRQTALDCFFRTCSDVLPNAPRLRRRLYWSLGCSAVGFASTAFNQGEMEVSARLSDFALDVCPAVKTSLPWMKLACKRRLGFRAWAALRTRVESTSINRKMGLSEE